MFRKILSLTLILTFLVGCTPKNLINESGNANLDFKTDEILYNIALPYKEGVISSYISSYIPNRFDIDEIEYGLMQISSNYYAPTKYSFREGQFLTKDILKSYLSPSDSNEYGLNPASTETIKISNYEIVPNYVSYILEQNYVRKEDNEYKTEGVAVALVLNPYQYYKSESGSTIELKVTDYNELIKFGESAANKLVANLRDVKGLRFAKITVGIYILEARDSLVPGKYVRVGTTTTDEIQNFENVNMETYIIPSKSFTDKDQNLSRSMTVFKDSISEQFGSYFSMIGYAKYYNNDIEKLTINLQVTFDSKTKLISLTQIVGAQLIKYLSGNYEIEVIISSVDKIKATIIRDNNNEFPKIHIYD